MAGPAAAAGAKAAGSAAASRAGSAGAAKGGGKAAAGRAGKRAASRRAGQSAKRRVFSPGGSRRGQGENQQPVSRGFFWSIAIAAGGLLFFLLLIIAPLVVIQASSGSCGGEGEEAVPIRTNHQSDPEDLGETQIAIRIYLVGQVMNMTPRQIVTAYATAYVESEMTNIYGGMDTSSGIYQQQNFSPWTDGGRNRNNIIDTSISFFLQLREYDHGQAIGDLAAEVQKPAEEYEYRYALRVDDATDIYNKVFRIVGSASGIGNLQSLQGATIGGSGLDSLSMGTACGAFTATGPANLQKAVTLYQPRAYKAIPQELMVAGRTPQSVDSRIWPDAVWFLKTFHLRVLSAREGPPHSTHGDGTAMDIQPEEGKGWDETTRSGAEALGWRESCGESGVAPACPLVPAIHFIGYNGYPDHGDPDHAPGNAHLHVSWASSSYGCGPELCPPPEWVRVFPVGEEVVPEKPSNTHSKKKSKAKRKAKA